jgi:CheY-like chemotaxis protein
LLRLLGHHVRTAYGGREALEATAANRPEVVLLDIGMPGLSGYEVAQALRSGPGHAGVVLVALTGFAGEEDRRRSRAAGFQQHLVKAVDCDALQALLTGMP